MNPDALDRQAIASDFGSFKLPGCTPTGFSGDVRQEGPCLSTHSEISLTPRADAFIFVPATVHDWATVVLGRAPTLSGEFVTEIGQLVYVFGKRCSLLLRLPEVLSRFCLFQPAWAQCARLTCHAAHLL